MVMHARSGGSVEAMGLMQGKIAGDTIIVTDAFKLPVEGTETRVNAQDEAKDYMVGYPTPGTSTFQCEKNLTKSSGYQKWYNLRQGKGTFTTKSKNHLFLKCMMVLLIFTEL